MAKIDMTWNEPWNGDAERSCLEACLVDSAVAQDVVEALDQRDFYRISHRLIFNAIEHLVEEGKATDAVTVKHRLEATGDLQEIGGCVELLNLNDYRTVIYGYKEHIAIVRELSLQRRIGKASALMIRLSERPQEDFDGYLDQVEETLSGVLSEIGSRRN